MARNTKPIIEIEKKKKDKRKKEKSSRMLKMIMTNNLITLENLSMI